MQQHPQGHLLQQAAWGRLKSAFGWEAQRLAIVAQATPDAPLPKPPLLAGAQLLFRARYGVSVAYLPRGPLFAGAEPVDAFLLTALERTARRRRAVFLRLEPNLLASHPQADSYHMWLLRKAFRPVQSLQPRSTIHLDLTPPLDRIFAGLSKGHRADIRRAERQGVTVTVGTAAEIAPFYRIMQATGQRAAFGIHNEEYYRRAWQLFQPHRSRLLLAMQDGQPVAGHMVFHDGRSGYYFYSGATEAGLKAGANHLLQWHALQWAREAGCHCYDLWGIPDALGQAATAAEEAQHAALTAAAQNDPLIGVYRFKKGFGGQIVRYLTAYDRVFLPPLYALWRRGVS